MPSLEIHNTLTLHKQYDQVTLPYFFTSLQCQKCSSFASRAANYFQIYFQTTLSLHRLMICQLVQQKFDKLTAEAAAAKMQY